MKKLLAVLLFSVTTQLCIAQQPIKTYNGDYMYDDQEGNAQYSYYEDPESGDRVKHGKFKFLSTGKGVDVSQTWYGQIVISNNNQKVFTGKIYEGNYTKGVKQGAWSYIDKDCRGADAKCMAYKLSGSYKDGKPDGIWAIKKVNDDKSETNAGSATFKNNTLVKIQYDSGVKSISGQADEQGNMTGVWKMKYRGWLGDKTTYEETREYKKGVLYKRIVRNSQTGDRIYTYFSKDTLAMLTRLDSLGSASELSYGISQEATGMDSQEPGDDDNGYSSSPKVPYSSRSLMEDISLLFCQKFHSATPMGVRRLVSVQTSTEKDAKLNETKLRKINRAIISINTKKETDLRGNSVGNVEGLFFEGGKPKTSKAVFYTKSIILTKHLSEQYKNLQENNLDEKLKIIEQVEKLRMKLIVLGNYEHVNDNTGAIEAKLDAAGEDISSISQILEEVKLVRIMGGDNYDSFTLKY